MMASLDISVAWSVAVPVDTFGAHLQAYVQLQPTMNTIRLCNRYGRGPKAAITKLPIELVTAIEGHIMDAEREKQRMRWCSDFLCFQGLCKPIDHFSEHEQLEIWNDILAEDGSLSDFSDYSGYIPRTRLSKSDREELNDILEVDADYNEPNDSAWMRLHDNRLDGWKGKTGAPHGQTRGLLSTYSSCLLKDFGIQIWVTHTQPRERRLDPLVARDANVSAYTVVYLTLPCGKVQDSFERAFSEWDPSDTPYKPTENGGGVPVFVPGALSQADRLRFGRAIKILDLILDEALEQRLALLRNDESIEKEGEEEGMIECGRELKVEDGLKRLWSPQVRVLYRQAVDGEY